MTSCTLKDRVRIALALVILEVATSSETSPEFEVHKVIAFYPRPHSTSTNNLARPHALSRDDQGLLKILGDKDKEIKTLKRKVDQANFDLGDAASKRIYSGTNSLQDAARLAAEGQEWTSAIELWPLNTLGSNRSESQVADGRVKHEIMPEGFLAKLLQPLPADQEELAQRLSALTDKLAEMLHRLRQSLQRGHTGKLDNINWPLIATLVAAAAKKIAAGLLVVIAAGNAADLLIRVTQKLIQPTLECVTSGQSAGMAATAAVLPTEEGACSSATSPLKEEAESSFALTELQQMGVSLLCTLQSNSAPLAGITAFETTKRLVAVLNSIPIPSKGGPYDLGSVILKIQTMIGLVRAGILKKDADADHRGELLRQRYLAQSVDLLAQSITQQRAMSVLSDRGDPSYQNSHKQIWEMLSQVVQDLMVAEGRGWDECHIQVLELIELADI